MRSELPGVPVFAKVVLLVVANAANKATKAKARRVPPVHARMWPVQGL